MKKQPSNLSRLMQYAGSHRYLTYASWILSAGSALLALVPFWYLWKIIAEVIDVMPDFSKAEHLIQNGWLAVLFAVLSFVVYVGSLMCSHLSAFRVATNLRLQMLHHLAELPLGFTQQFGSGKLRKTINESSGATETYLAHMLPDTANAIATPIGLIALLLFFDWKLGLLSLIPVAAGFLVMTSMTGENMKKKKMEEYQNALDEMSNEAVEYVRGIPVVKTFGQTVFSFQRFKQSIDRYKTWTIAYTKDLRVPMMLYTTVINGVFAVLIAAALVMTRNGVTDTFLLNLLFYIIITPVISLTMTKMMFMSENGMIVADALKRVDTILDAAPLSNNAAGTVPTDASIQLQHVSYSYDGKRNALDDISLTIPSGKTAAFVGSSGSGKTTAANLISRFFDTQKGAVIGGVNVKEIPKEQLMETVSFVFQNSRLIKGTILDNVKMGKPDATKQEVRSALEQAQCMDILEKLPNGLQTVIGTGGISLSGGEQQRIAIARTILKNAPILIFDEATAFADPDNEAKVQAAISALAKDKTILIIAHRLSTITHADCIFVLEEGKLIESGTTEELQRKNGVFQKMWDAYQTSVQWKVSKEGQTL